MKTLPYTIVLLMMVLSMSLEKSAAQIYTPVRHLDGTQTINGNNVTVTSSVPGNRGGNYCGEGPYLVGVVRLSNGLPPFFAPTSYLFSFSKPVRMVTIRLTGVAENTLISFSVNGLPYSLTPANFATFPFPCNPITMAAIVGGALNGLVSGYPGSVRAIHIIGDISSIEVHSKSKQVNMNADGAIFGLYLTEDYKSVCQGDDIKLSATGTPGAVYSWTGPKNFTSNIQNPIIAQASTDDVGFYTVVKSFGRDTFIEITHIDVLPNPVTQILFDQPLCSGSDLALTDTNKLPGTQYHWSGPNGFNSDIQNPVISNVKSYHSGTYSLTTTLGECSYTTDTNITIHDPFYSQTSEVTCDNMPFTFNGRALNQAGLYRDSFQTTYGCDSIVSLDLIVLPTPELDINLDFAKMRCLGDTLILAAKPPDPTMSYQWYLNDTASSNQPSLSMHLIKMRNHITLKGIADNGCEGAAEVDVRVRSCCDLFVPNAFSPNNDGHNDAFGPRFYGNMPNFQMAIYNRLGERIFLSEHQEKLWDGSYKGIPLDPGVYFYYITGNCFDGTSLIRKGDLTLLR